MIKDILMFIVGCILLAIMANPDKVGWWLGLVVKNYLLIVAS